MSEIVNVGGFTIKINEDGTITQIGSLEKNASIGRSNRFNGKPSISKFYLTSDQMKCGETVKLFWTIEDSDENTLNIAQGDSTSSYCIPDTGDLNITSNLSDDNISIEICSENDNGKVYARRSIVLSKGDNTFKSTKTSSVISYLYYGLFILGILFWLISLFF